MTRPRPSLPFVLAFLVIGVGFVASTLYAELRSSAIDREITALATNAHPSVSHLVAARAALRHLEVASERLARTTPGDRDPVVRSIFQARRDLDRAVAEELATPDYAGEHELAASAEQEIVDLDALLDRAITRPFEEGDSADVELHQLVDRTDAGLDRWLTLNATEGERGVARIIAIRRDSLAVALALDGACAFLSMGAAVLALRALKRWREAEATNARFLLERANELEMFAKRVAHDLLSPLSSLSFSLQAFKRPSAGDAKLTLALKSAHDCIARAHSMVDGIFEFARAGALAAGGGRADVREVVLSVAEEVRSSSSSADIIVEDFEDSVVACAPGVLMSLLANLLRNAVKFTSDSSLRQITVRIRQDEASVRVEVEDTGPGIPRGMEQRIFEPYVRGEGVTQSGLGLGLATVKRLCEAHRGAVGVRSSLGRGSLFWFTLPRAA